MTRIAMTLILLCAVSTSLQAAIDVFACEPEWAALAEMIGGEAVSVTAATTAQQDPHHIQARPSLIARMRRAELVICTGADLEAGWLPLLLRRAGNPAVQPGRPGYLEAATAVTLLDRPADLDRAAGDVHAQGNPHIQTSPHNIAAVARALQDRLARVDPSHADGYRQRFDDFLQQWHAATRRWEEAAGPLRGMRVAVQHSSWVYLNDWLGLEQVATLEPKPGVPPSTADLENLLEQLGTEPPAAILRAAWQDARPAEWLSGRTGIPVVELPFTVGGSAAAPDLYGLFEATLEALLAVRR
ncbi:MAG: zinc ABC transporter substrate-binding protein [Gammaproteobacteria bacterium]|jgi:zinc/manganese transport system substrate-binding protein